MNRSRMLASLGVVTLLAACGGDDDGGESMVTSGPTSTAAVVDTTEPATTSTAPVTTTTVADTTNDSTNDTTDATTDATATSGTESAPAADFTELCALAQEMNNQGSAPTVAQLTQYQALAPEEIRTDIDALVQALVLVPEGDLVALFNAIGDDAIEAHKEATDAFEEENCDIAEDDAPADGATREIDDDATRVDVAGFDYVFEFDPTVESGRTSFVLTNEGVEAHVMLVVKLAPGVSLQDVVEADDLTGMTEGAWDTKLAAAGGDEEAITFDVEPGHYGMVCYVPTADGTPHALLGMATEFTVRG